MPCARGSSGGHALQRTQMSRKSRRRESVTTVKLRLEPVHTRKHMLSRARTQVQTCKRTTYVHAYIHTYKHEYISTVRHTHIHACMHTYMHTVRERFVPSPPTPRTLQTPHVADFCLLKLCSARHLLVRVIKETVASEIRRSDVDHRTYVCVHSEGNNTICCRRAPRRTRTARRYEEVLQLHWSQLYTVNVRF